ncbi:MAG: MFS transporter [Dehalococcoidia bacterium]
MRDLAVFSSLRHDQYRRLWLATLLSTVASWTVLTGRGWFAFDLHHHSSTVGLVFFAAMLPYLLVTPVAGVLADRFDRRGLLLASLVISLLSALALALYALGGGRAAWPLVVLAFVNGAARSVEVPASQSMVPAMVPERDLLNAVALGGLATHGSRLLGPLLAAPLLDSSGAAGAFFLATAMYVIALVQVFRVQAVIQATSRTIGAGAQLLEGARYVLRDRVVLLIIGLVFFHCGLSMAYDAVLPVMAHDVLGSGGTSYSWLVMMIGLGSLIGTFALAGLPTGIHRGWLLFATGMLSGFTIVLLAFAHRWPEALGAAALVGGSQAIFMALTNTILQIVTPDWVRGRVLSIYLMVGGGVMAFANLVTGRLADAYGVTLVLALPALAFMAIVALSLLGPPIRRVYLRRAAPVAVH